VRKGGADEKRRGVGTGEEPARVGPVTKGEGLVRKGGGCGEARSQ
jgi:hypothetical protein